ncbi:gliding motility-associated C-terminal domain-containing protein [Sunxiuqinia rutila]|uniref:T9SS type B sorting domain-containing protein n=1 Tax=Sunxiuqinia rutila TaxID=1397841 RepID=UPI003D365C56
MRLFNFLLAGLLVLTIGVYADTGDLNEEKGGVKIQELDLYVAEESSICFDGDVLLDETASLTNQGTVYFHATSPATVTFSGKHLGDGSFVFAGNSDIDLDGFGSSLGSFRMDKPEGDVFLNGDLFIHNSLVLTSGVVHISNESLFKIVNAAADAVMFSNSANNASYVDGKLIREVLPGDTYWFPVGDDYAFHPLFISDAKNGGTVDVLFDGALFADAASMINDPNVRKIEPWGWQVFSESSTPNRFTVGQSMFDAFQNILGVDDYSMLYARADDFLFKDYSIDYESRRVNDFYLLGNTKNSSGFYGQACASVLELVNFILLDGMSYSVFEVPNISRYSQIELEVYNRWGAMVYKNQNYQNDLDFAHYTPGTYYYQMTLWTGDSPFVVRNVVEVKSSK